jgi:hypothetical protein
VDPFELRTKLTFAALLGVVWTFLAMLPLMLAGKIDMPPLMFWWLPAGLWAYFTYTGIRAWRRGWTSRFVLRIVVPIALLLVSALCTAAWMWVAR